MSHTLGCHAAMNDPYVWQSCVRHNLVEGIRRSMFMRMGHLYLVLLQLNPQGSCMIAAHERQAPDCCNAA